MKKFTLLLLVVLFLSTLIVPTRQYAATPTTWFVRNDGGDTTQCTGKTNVKYSGSGTAQDCAFKNPQDAVNASTWGDIIKLHAGDTFDFSYGLNLIDKGTPPTGTDADFITLTTDDPSLTPAAVFKYPAEDVRITTAMAAGMPRVRISGAVGVPAIWINKKSEYWAIERLNITNDTPINVGNVVRLIGGGEQDPATPFELPEHIRIRYNWIHPQEETGEPLSTANIYRTADNAIYLDARHVLVENNALQGFVGLYRNGAGRITSSNYLSVGVSDDIIIRNNLLEAWTYANFFGGGGSWATKFGTVSNCTPTSCVVSNTDGLQVGMAFAVVVYEYTDGWGIARKAWGNAFVSAINGSTVTFKSPLCGGVNDPNGNSCLPFPSTALRQVPADGARAQWDGYVPQNVLVQSNIFAHRPEWEALLTDSGGKGYLELKNCRNCTWNGNIFKGSTGLAITTRNQDGSIPWATLDGLTFTNNYFMDSNSPFTAVLSDSANLTRGASNVTFSNNLAVGLKVSPGYEYFSAISGNFQDGYNVTITHNTVLVGAYRGFISYANSPIRGLTMKDNIFRAAPNQCLSDGSGTSSAPMNQCWPSGVVERNLLVLVDGWPIDDIKNSWTNIFPNNTIVTSLGAVGFTNPTAKLDSAGNYQLAATSPYKNAASDGKDLGVDYVQLNNAIYGGAAPPPTPSPTPTPSPSPSPTVTPTPTPSTTKATIEVMTTTDNAVVSVQGVGSCTVAPVINLQGYYRCGVLVDAGTWQVGISKQGYTFDPASFNVPILQPQGTASLFSTATAVTPSPTPTPTPTPTSVTVSGRIATSTGQPVAGALIMIKTTNAKTVKQYTKADGTFSFTVANLKDYALIPVASEYWVYEPCFKGIRLNGNSVGNDFVAIPTNKLLP